MAGLGPFDYLIKETEQAFFQDAAEGIAKEASAAEAVSKIVKSTKGTGLTRTAKGLSKSQKAALRSDAGLSRGYSFSPEELSKMKEYAAQMGVALGHGGNPAKVAMLIYKSNQDGLCKQASEYIDSISTYNDLVNIIAASSPLEPLGMTKTALAYLDDLDEMGIDKDTVFIIGENLLYDAAHTDSLIEEALEKNAAFNPATFAQGLAAAARAAPAAASAVAPVARQVSKAGPSLAESIMEAGRVGLREPGAIGATREFVRGAGKTIADTARGAGKAVTETARKGWRPMSEAGGIRKYLGEKVRRLGTAIESPFRGIHGKILDRSIANKTRGLEELAGKADKLRASLADAAPGRAEEIGMRLKDVTKTMSKRQESLNKTLGKQEQLHKETGIRKEKVTKTPSQASREAKDAARPKKPKKETTPDPDTASATGGGPKLDEYVQDANSRWNRAGGPRGVGVNQRDSTAGTRSSTSPGENVGGDKSKKDLPKKPNYTEAKTPPGYNPNPKTGEAPKGAPEPAVPPAMPTPAQAENLGIKDIYSKWKEGGWGSLSGAEKRRVMVLGAGAFVGQRVILGENKII